VGVSAYLLSAIKKAKLVGFMDKNSLFGLPAIIYNIVLSLLFVNNNRTKSCF